MTAAYSGRWQTTALVVLLLEGEPRLIEVLDIQLFLICKDGGSSGDA
jgi:hypothetical protein